MNTLQVREDLIPWATCWFCERGREPCVCLVTAVDAQDRDFTIGVFEFLHGVTANTRKDFSVALAEEDKRRRKEKRGGTM